MLGDDIPTSTSNSTNGVAPVAQSNQDLLLEIFGSSSSTSGIPTGPSAMVGTQVSTASSPRSPRQAEEQETPAEDETKTTKSDEETKPVATTTMSPKKYFIVKSLTLQDLELSVRNGIWATQSHNEETLNKAFEVRFAPQDM